MTCSEFLNHFWNPHQFFNIFKKRWPWWLIYFPNYGVRKTWLGKCLESPISEHPVTVNMLKVSKHLLNLYDSTYIIFSVTLGKVNYKISLLVIFEILALFITSLAPDDKDFLRNRSPFRFAWQHFYHILSSILGKVTWKMFLLVICEILAHFVNTLSAHDKYSLLKSRVLRQSIQMQFSKKKANFSGFLDPSLISTSIFEYFEKKDDPHRLYIFKINECERRGWINV